MMENVISRIGGVGVFGVISISIFFAFFTGMLLWSLRLKKNYLQTMQSLPLDDGSTDAGQRAARAEADCCGQCKCGEKARAQKPN